MRNNCFKYKYRNSSIELLRIVIMFLIVLHHSVVHGGFPSSTLEFSFNRIVLGWFRLGDLAVDIFVILMGYFMCKKEFNFLNIIKLMKSVWFYSIIFLIVALLSGYEINIEILIKSIFPFIFNHYWFITVYIVVEIFSPFINIFIAKLDKKMFEKCILIMVVLWSVIPTFTTQIMYGTELLQFLMLYMIGAYMRYFPIQKKLKKSITLILFGSSFLLFGSSIVIEMIKQIIPIFVNREAFLYVRSSLLVVIISTCLFAKVIDVKPFYNKYINKISSCMFGVYLIHENIIMRKIIWMELVNNSVYVNDNYLFLRLLFSSLVVFVICVLVELMRKILFERIEIIFSSYKLTKEN